MGWFSARKSPSQQQFEAEAMPHMDALYGNALRLTRSPADAEDLVQETFLKAFQFFDRFERGTNLKAWLFRIQYNAFVNRYRRHTKEQSITESLAQSPIAETTMGRGVIRTLVDPVGNALRPMVAKEIEAALNALPEEHRVVVLLADVEELSYKEIAEVVGCPIGTVMSRLHRARKTLQKLLAEYASESRAPSSPDVVPTATETSEPVSLTAFRQSRSKR
jgi:RNA polymerase sigma-70 factor, ECF subfamily